MRLDHTTDLIDICLRRGSPWLTGVWHALWISFLAAGVFGCGSGDAPPPATPAESGAESASNPQALLDEWKDLIGKPEANLNNPRLVVLASMLAAQAPNMLNVMIDVLVDPATQPHSKLMVLSSLEAVMDSSLVPRLLQLTEQDVDPVVRSGVTMLLSGAKTPEVASRLAELSTDKDSRVRLAALNAMVVQGDAPARETLREWFLANSTPQPYRERIALTLSMQPAPGDAPVLAAALGDTAIDPGTRMSIAGALSTLGGPEALNALNQCVEGDAPEDLKVLARDAVAAIQARQTPAGEAPGAGAAVESSAVNAGNG